MRSPHTTLRLAVAVAGLCAASGAWAAGGARVSVAGVRNDPGGAVAAQLAKGVCAQLECVPAARVKRGGALSFDAVRAERVAGVLFGTVASGRGKRSLELALLTTSLNPRRTWVVAMDAKGRLAPRDLDRVVADLTAALAPPPAPAVARAAPPPVAAPAPVGPPAAAPAAAPPPAPEPVRARPERAEAPATAPPARAPAAAERVSRTTRPGRPGPEPVARTPAAEPRAIRPPLGAVDLGVRLAQRDLSYSGVGAGALELQKFEADGIVSPTLRLELYPGGLASDGWPSRIAVLAAFSRSVGFEAEESARPGVKHSAALTQVEVGAGYRLFLGSTAASLLPRVTWRKHTLEVKAARGAVIAGLPDADLSGPSFGLDLDLPLRGRLGLFAGLAYTKWTTAEDLVGGDPRFFSSGSASAIDASAGASFRLARALAVRAAVEWSRTSYTLSGTSSYSATGATDSYLGASVAARLDF